MCGSESEKQWITWFLKVDPNLSCDCVYDCVLSHPTRRICISPPTNPTISVDIAVSHRTRSTSVYRCCRYYRYNHHHYHDYFDYQALQVERITSPEGHPTIRIPFLLEGFVRLPPVVGLPQKELLYSVMEGKALNVVKLSLVDTGRKTFVTVQNPFLTQK